MAAPVANFTATPTSGEYPLVVQFVDTSTGDPTSWYWDFNDGSFSFEQNPVCVFTDPGTYTITLYAYNEDGIDDEVKLAYITVMGPPAPVASFSGTPLSGESPLTVQFTDTSTNDPTAWYWDLGNGTGVNTAQNPQALYTEPGLYTVTLTANNGSGSNSLTRTSYVQVLAPTCPPTVYSLDGNQVGLPHTTANDIPYEIESTSYREQWVFGANNTVLTARVLDVDSYQWIDDMVGTVASRRVSGGGLRYARSIPQRHAFIPDQWCTQVVQIDQGDSPTCPGVAGPVRGIPSGWPVPRWSRWRCTFEGLPYQIQTDEYCDSSGYGEWCRFLIRKRRSYAKEYRYGANAFQVTGTNQNIPAQQVGYVGFGEITYIQVGVPCATIPWNYLDSLIGCINDRVIDTVPGGYGTPAKCLLFLGFNDQNRYWSSSGQWVCDLEFYFRTNNYGWDAVPNAEGAWRRIETVALPHRPPYPLNDFANLLNPGT